MSLKRIAIALILVAVGGLATWFGLGQLFPKPQLARHMQPIELRVTVVDYTVPHANYFGHRGLFWLFEHLRVTPPSGAKNWNLAADYIGYRPNSKASPQRLADGPIGADVLYIADTYGVYFDDIHGEEDRTAMDVSPLVFGGISPADAKALVTFANRGGHVIAEFNTLCDPTRPPVRKRLEKMLGITWTGWTGRVFPQPTNPDQVPRWLPRLFAKQYPDRVYPRASPMLILVHRSGKLLYATADKVEFLLPRLFPSSLGSERFPVAKGDAPHTSWFPVMQAGPNTRVYANIVFPSVALDMLKEAKLPRQVPLITEYVKQDSFRIYFGANFSDANYELGSPYHDYAIDVGRKLPSTVFDGARGRAGFFRLFAPIVRSYLLMFQAKKRGKARARELNLQ